MEGIKYTVKKDTASFLVNGKIYSFETILNTAFIFIDRAYVFLDGDPKLTVKVYLRSKNKITHRDNERLAGEFYNELLNQTMRQQLLQNNKQLREFLIGSAMLGAIGERVNLSGGASEELETEKENEKEFDKLLKKELKMLGKDDSFDGDPLDILIPWEEKNKKSKKIKKIKKIKK